MTILWNNSRGEFEEIVQQYSLCLWWILGKRTWLWYKKELQNWEMISQPKLEITVEPVLRGSASRGHSCGRFSRSRNCHPLIILVSPTSLFYRLLPVSNGSVRAESLNKTKNNLSSKIQSILIFRQLILFLSEFFFFFTLSGQLRHNKAIFNSL